jgi:hypothetical protein
MHTVVITVLNAYVLEVTSILSACVCVCACARMCAWHVCAGTDSYCFVLQVMVFGNLFKFAPFSQQLNDLLMNLMRDENVEVCSSCVAVSVPC